MNYGHLGRELHVVGVGLCPLSKIAAPSCYLYFPPPPKKKYLCLYENDLFVIMGLCVSVIYLLGVVYYKFASEAGAHHNGTAEPIGN